MYKFVPVFLFLLVGCDPGPAVPCDYCHAMREGAKRYTCDKCQKTHSACDVDRAVMHYSEAAAYRGRISYSATAVLTCPSPEEPKALYGTIAPPNPWPLWKQIMFGSLALAIFFGGYAKGRRDEAKSVFPKNEESLKERGLK